MFSIFEEMSIQFKIASLKHKLTANNRHGTHSPFVYKLADEVIYDFSSKKVYETVEAQRKKLLNDDTDFVSADLNEDDSQTKNSKKVKRLAKSLLKKPRLGQLIFRLAAHHVPKNVIMLGANLGITTAYIAKACPQANLIVLEEYSNTASIANQVFEELKLTNVELQVGDFNSLLPKIVAEVKSLDFVYIDGSHTKGEILNYLNCCLPKLNEHSLLIIDDIYRNEDIKAAWAEIKNHPQVTVTVDLFWLGLVYFKKGQAKEHFKLKF